MPRNSSGVYSKPAGTTPSVGQVIDPVPWNALTTDLGNEITNSLPRDGSAPMTAPLKNADGSQAQPSVTFSSEPATGMYLKAAGVAALVAGGSEVLNWSGSGVSVAGNFSTSGVLKGRIDYAEKSGNYLAVAADAGSTLRFTATANLTLTAAATLAAGWSIDVFAEGGTVTVDPNGSETINGAATLTIPIGATAVIICDGTAFFTLSTNEWEPIRNDQITAQGAIDVTNLGAFEFIRFRGYLEVSVAGTVGLQTSTNNGSSFDGAANDYAWQSIFANNTSISGNRQNSTSMLIGGGVDSGANNGVFLENVEMANFNKTKFAKFKSSSTYVSAGAVVLSEVGGHRASTTARNAIRILCSSGTMTGHVIIEGIRG
ncbi:hypothetical protein FHX10_004530 [Rhizobium sp. BK591]|uniref:hypothetical protein n=1 Tax=Rhizobium sp. BK591 TaxID=2586985 RepID=UPI0016087AC6|nr:hypothetical protein [Rhizobium sp. BK591]MBB3744993.1 hypothetical protein [Rhizobium sp. BK591]